MPRRKQLPQAPVGDEPEGLQMVPALHALRIADHAFDYGIDELITNIERAAAARRRRASASRDRAPRRSTLTRAEPQERASLRSRGAMRTERTPPAGARTRRTRTLAALAIGAVVVAVGVILLVSSGGGGGGDDGGSATVDGAAIEVGNHPVDLAYGEGGLWVTNRLGASVSFVNTGESGQADRHREDRRRARGRRGRRRRRLRHRTR